MTGEDRVKAGLRALLSDLAAHEPQIGRECKMAQDKLDLYVSDELDGLDARIRHPDVWRHLQVCESCRAEHDDLLDLLMAEAQGQLAPLPPRRAAAVVPAQAPWQVHVVAAQAPARPTLTFVFAPAYLRQSLRPAAAAQGMRIAEPGPIYGDALILSYLGDTPAGETMVQLYARREVGVPEHCLLTVVAVAEPMPRAAVLVWGGQEFEAALSPDGAGHFSSVPLAVLEAAEAPAEGFALRLLA